MGAPTPLVSTIPRPWRPPNVLLRSSREHFWEMFLIRTRDDGGSEDRLCTIDNSCFEVVERCRYVAWGMEFDLMSLWSTSDTFFPLPLYSKNWRPGFAFKYPPILGLISSCNTKINHTCFDGTVKYFQPPHNFTTSCTLEFFLCNITLFVRFFLFFCTLETWFSLSELKLHFTDFLLHFSVVLVLLQGDLPIAHFTAMLGEGWEALFCLCVMNTRNVRFFTNNQYEVIFEPNNKSYFFTYINMWKALPLR